MAVRQYTTAQLLALRESPLVVKPDNLPAIEQWIDEHAHGNQNNKDNNANNPREGNSNNRQRQQRHGLSVTSAAGAESSSPMGAFSTGRPTLGTRSSTLRGTNGDDIALGPPRTMFPSSRNVSKLSDFSGQGDITTGEESSDNRSRFFDRVNRRSLNNDKESGKDNRDSWTSARERREGQRDRDDRHGRHDKEDGERRNGFGDRHDPRWGAARDERKNGDRPGGWREREQQRRDRDGEHRNHQEKEPEWMDDPVVKKDQQLGYAMPKTQEEFQKWKESMSKKSRGGPEESEKPLEAAATTAESAPPPPEPKTAVAPLKLEGFENGVFGGWASNVAQSAPSASIPPAATLPKASTTMTGKGKTSRFASMFKPVEEPPAAALPPPPATEESDIQKASNTIAQTSAEDHKGFENVLKMLGAQKLSNSNGASPQAQTPASPPPVPKPATGSNGTASKPKSRFTDMFAAKSPQSPTQSGGAPQQGVDSMFGNESRSMGEDSQKMFGGALQRPFGEQQQLPHRTQAHGTPSMSPELSGIPFNALREQQPRPQSGRVNDIMFDPPSRGAASPDISIQNLLTQQRQRPQATSSESQQLLNLLKKDTSSSRPPSQAALLGNNGGIDQGQLHHWLENQHRSGIPAEPHAPKPRVPQQPPGLFEEQLMRNYPQEQQQQQRQDQPAPPMPGLTDMAQRRTSQRAPPGFFDEQAMLLQHQQQQQQQHQLRRQFNDGPPVQQMPPPGRRMSGHPNLPQMQIPHQQAGQQFPPEFHQLMSPIGAGGGGQPPPPGFNPHMPRHPPGFHNINIFQQGPQQRDNGMAPPGFAGNMGLQSPPGGNAPPGFYGGPQGGGGGGGVPPGFATMQPMRSPADNGLSQGLRGNGFDLGGGVGGPGVRR